MCRPGSGAAKKNERLSAVGWTEKCQYNHKGILCEDAKTSTQTLTTSICTITIPPPRVTQINIEEGNANEYKFFQKTQS